MDTFTLENGNLSLAFDRVKGTLISITAIKTGWKILDRPHLGLSFRLLLPLSEERRNNPVHGEKQRLTRVEISPNRRLARLVWDSVTSDHGGKHAIRLTQRVTLDEHQAVFAMTIENRSEYTIENAYLPYLGDVQPPPGAEWFKTFSYSYATAAERWLWPKYENLRGYYGADYPLQFAPSSPDVGVPMAPFILLRSAEQGLFAGVAEQSCELVAWHTELRPGYGSSIDWRLPEERTVSNLDVATRFAAVHLPFIQPGETRALTPISLETFQGDWQAGVNIYKAWRNTWMKPAPVPAWAKEPHAWQQIHINSPEDELRTRFSNLVQIGADCAKHGVKAIQLVGWNEGGQDQGNPLHSPDPRLGTFQELKQAIADIQAFGVKVILFAKFTWADRATQWFREELVRMSIKDPYGDYYLFPGYQYQTATQLLDINTRRLIPMCFLSEEYLQVCEEEFKKILNLGADGILFDECLHHSPALLCFDPNHGHRIGAPVYANDRELIHRFTRISKLVNPEFLYAGEACYDWEMEVYQLSYHRSENKAHIPLSRYLLPQGQFMTAITGFNDRNMINQCLLYRYVISYEPFNFKGRLDDFPQTLEYGKKMDYLRTELREFFWDGEFLGTIPVSVTCDGRPHHPYSAFRSHQTGKIGLVIANYDEKQAVHLQVTSDGRQALSRYRLVDDPQWGSTKPYIVIPQDSAVVVME